MSRLPLDESLSRGEEKTLINRLFDTLRWLSPVVNIKGGYGAVEPPDAYRRDGMVAYADGTSWDPAWGQGVYRYSMTEHDDPHWEPVDPRESVKSYTVLTTAGSKGTHYAGGFYEAPSADANLTQAGATITYGNANGSYAAHAFIVFGAASGSGGSGTDRKIKLTVSGTRIQDNGTATAAYSEVLTDDAEGLTLNDFIEAEKYLGTATYTLSATGVDPYTSFSMDFNYGLCKYDDLGNHAFHINTFECVLHAGANDSDVDIQLIHHKGTGWTYSAAAFDPVVAANVICSLQTDHTAGGTDYFTIVDGMHFAYKRANLHEHVSGDLAEGFIIRAFTSVNNSLEYLNMHVGYH